MACVCAGMQVFVVCVQMCVVYGICVYACVCGVCVCVCMCECVCMFACLCFKEKEQNNVKVGGWESGDHLGENRGQETMLRI